MSEILNENNEISKEITVQLPVAINKLEKEVASEAAIIRNPVGSDYLFVNYGDHQLVVVLSEIVKAVESEAKKS